MRGSRIKQNSLGMVLIVGFLMLLGTKSSAQELQEYLQLAAENNAGLQAARVDYEVTLQQLPQVRSLPDPNLTVSAFGKMEDARISLMQQLPWFGTLEAREDEASLLAEAQYQIYLDKRNLLFYQVSEQYFQLYFLTEQVRYEKENKQVLEDLKELNLDRMRSGAGSLAEVLQVDLLLNQSVSDLKLLDMNFRPVTSRINALLNREATTKIRIPDTLVLQEIPLVGLDDLELNPQVLEMEKRIAAAEYGIAVAKKSGLPQLGIGLDLMVNQRMMMEQRGENVLMPMLSVSLPIFRKKYKAAKERAHLQQESYSLQQQQLYHELEASLEEVIFEAEKIREQLSLYEDQVKSSQQILSLLLAEYRNSNSSFERVLRVRQDLLTYRLKMAQARARYLTQLARITYLTGNSLKDDIAK